MEIPIPLIITKSGNEKLVHQDYVYIFDKYVDKGSQKAWRCQHKSKGCKARIWSDLSGEILQIPKNLFIQHNHEPNPASIIGQQLMAEVRKRAMETNDSAAQIEAALLREMPEAAARPNALPSMSAIKMAVKRARMEPKNEYEQDEEEQEDCDDDDAEYNGDQEQIDTVTDRQSMRVPSAIWTCFDRGSDKARCKMCFKDLACKNSSTKGLWDHLKTRHRREYSQLSQNKEVVIQSTSKSVSTSKNIELQMSELIAGQDNPQMEVIQVKSTKRAHHKATNSTKNSVVDNNNSSFDHNSQNPNTQMDLPQTSHQQPQPGNSCAGMNLTTPSTGNSTSTHSTLPISHILIWTNPSNLQNNPTYILINLLDDNLVDPLRRPGEYSLAYVVHQKLGANPEPSGCCFSTTMPVNFVLNEFSILGYRIIGMVSKMPGEVLWTLAKS